CACDTIKNVIAAFSRRGRTKTLSNHPTGSGGGGDSGVSMPVVPKRRDAASPQAQRHHRRTGRSGSGSSRDPSAPRLGHAGAVRAGLQVGRTDGRAAGPPDGAEAPVRGSPPAAALDLAGRAQEPAAELPGRRQTFPGVAGVRAAQLEPVRPARAESQPRPARRRPAAGDAGRGGRHRPARRRDRPRYVQPSPAARSGGLPRGDRPRFLRVRPAAHRAGRAGPAVPGPQQSRRARAGPARGGQRQSLAPSRLAARRRHRGRHHHRLRPVRRPRHEQHAAVAVALRGGRPHHRQHPGTADGAPRGHGGPRHRRRQFAEQGRSGADQRRGCVCRLNLVLSGPHRARMDDGFRRGRGGREAPGPVMVRSAGGLFSDKEKVVRLVKKFSQTVVFAGGGEPSAVRYDIVQKPSFYNDLFALPKDVQKRITGAVRRIAADPVSGGGNSERCLKHLYSNLYRYRIGDYRLLYAVGDRCVSLLAIGHRNDIYDRFRASPADLRPGPCKASSAERRGIPTTAYETMTQAAAAGEFDEDGAAAQEPPLEKTPQLLLELLDLWGVEERYHDAILRCRSVDELLDLDLPEDITEKLLHWHEPPDIDRIIEQPTMALDDVEDLNRYMEGSLKRFLLKLDPEQERVAARTLQGPTLVKGGPGTGKSLVALYRLKNLLEAPKQGVLFAEKTPRILFVTYTRALINVSEELLVELLG